MCEKRTGRFGRKIAVNAAGCALVLGAMSAYADGSSAEQDSPSLRPLQARAVALRVADLEKAFWICDYAATTQGLEATPVSVCSAVTEELKATKFGGDFEKLLGWWRQNKPAEHQELARSGR